MKEYNFNNLAGCVVQRKSRATKTVVGVYNSVQAGLEDDPSCVWMCVCEAHNILVGHQSLKLALFQAVHPEEWCEFCAARDNLYVTDEYEDGFAFTLDEFIKNNECLDEREKEVLRDLQVGETYTFGGGAAATMCIKRKS